MTKVNNGIDHVARIVGGDDAGRNGTATGTSTTTLTDSGATWPVSSGGPPENGGLVGHIVQSAGVYGNIVKNTGTVLTIDFWHSPTAPNTVGSTPGNVAYEILPGGAPAWYLGFSVATRVIAAADPFLTNDGTTVSEVWNTGGALNRQKVAYAHTNGTATYTISSGTLTLNSNDTGTSLVLNRIGIFAHGLQAAPTTITTGVMLYETNIPSAPTVISGDSISVTDTITIS